MTKRFAVVIGAAAVAGLVVAIGAQSAAAATNICVAKDGVVLQQSGTASCSADPGSTAIAQGAGSSATAGGSGNVAKAIGADSSASTSFGTNQTAIAIQGGTATTLEGDNLSARAVGDSSARAGEAPGNTAIAIGDGSSAVATVGVNGSVRPTTADDVAVMLAYAHKVAIVPGYGMAVAQAQHDVRALADQLESRGVEVTYAIHPVAGRMPGHMNVLLAEANVPYPALKEMDDANAEFPRTDVSLVIGANDVVNPDARNNESSPIYGMPILDVDASKTTVVLKRSMNPGFAGVDNPLFVEPNTLMLFGDAKESVAKLTAAVKAL